MKQRTQTGLIALLLATASLSASAQTVFFTDNFSNGSTTNGPSIRTGLPNASATSYDIASTKNTIPGTNGTTIAPNLLHLALAGPTTSGFLEAQAMFATNGQPVALTTPGDYLEIRVVFTNSAGAIFNTASSALWVGLFNSGGALPPSGGALALGTGTSTLSTTAGSPYAVGNCSNWVGYVSQVNSNGTSKVYTRPIQNGGGTTSANQELLVGGFGSGGFVNPSSTTISTLSPNAPITLATSGAYTLDMVVTATSAASLSISNMIYSGAGVGGSVIFSQVSTNVTNATFLTTVFDGFAIGLAGKLATPGADPIIDISSITILGQSTPIGTPPTITLQPVPVVVATNGSCIFTTAAVGSGVTYQWKRNNISLTNGAEISGATSGTLVISPAGIADQASYYCLISGSGGFTTNSATNSLTLVPSKTLTWTSAGGTTWDLNNTVSWQDSGSTPRTFNYGDSVIFDDSTSASKFVTLSGSYLSAASVTVNSGSTYSFTGSGSIAGPGKLFYLGNGQLTLNAANTYSGGTVVSNPTPGASYVLLQNYNGLGTGGVTLNNNGGTLEATTTGSASLGIAGTVNVLDDFFIKADGNGSFATVLLGDLAGTANKTLTFYPGTPGTTNRYRVYGTNTVFNANLVINNVDGPVNMALYNGTVLAPYEGTGSQSYNGIISGVGGIVQRGSGLTYLNNDQNTYSGGTFPTAGGIAFGADSIPTTGTVTSGPIGTGALVIATESGSTTGSGTVEAAGGSRTIGNALVYPSGTNNLTLIIGGSNNLTFTANLDLNGLDGINTNSVTSRLLQVGNTAATTFTGTISDSASFYGLTKSGTGALYLNGANTYTGTTTNSAGLLTGSGSVAGNVIVSSTNASIGGGASTGIGTFSIGGNLTLTNGGGFFRVNHAGSLSDKVSVGGVLTNAGTGTITITNLGAPLVAGDTFTLFSKAVANGGALTIASAEHVIWTNKLALNGTVQVVSTVGTTPGPITFSQSGTNLTLSWPANYQSWILQSNIVSVVSTNWVNIPNSQNATQFQININPARSNVFYRLIRPF